MSELNDLHAVILARDEEIQRRRTGKPYNSGLIADLDAWLGEIMNFQCMVYSRP